MEARPLRIALFVLTALSAVAALFVQPALRAAVARRAVGEHWLYVPVLIYGIFFLAYARDRWLLVRQRSYPTGKAFFQVCFGLVFALLVLPSSPEAGDPIVGGGDRLLVHGDAEVRRAAVEALGFRGEAPSARAQVEARLRDADARVRAAARDVLASWSSTTTLGGGR